MSITTTQTPIKDHCKDSRSQVHQSIIAKIVSRNAWDKQKSPSQKRGAFKFIRRRPTLPRSLPRSTIGAKELNFRVRDGNGCDLFAIATENF
jgi:hypothetical protein